jgi:hypothetical protein
MLTAQSDACATRKLILDGSSWLPAGIPITHPPRRIVRTTVATSTPIPVR